MSSEFRVVVPALVSCGRVPTAQFPDPRLAPTPVNNVPEWSGTREPFRESTPSWNRRSSYSTMESTFRSKSLLLWFPDPRVLVGRDSVLTRRQESWYPSRRGLRDTRVGALRDSRLSSKDKHTPSGSRGAIRLHGLGRVLSSL